MDNSRPFSATDSHNLMQPVLDLLQGTDPEVVCRRYGITRSELESRFEAYQISRRQMALQDHFAAEKAGRNDPCPCGSGKKYKKCCLPRHEEARRSLPPDKVREMEEKAGLRRKIEEEVRKGFELLYARDYGRVMRLASRMIEVYPEDDRFHDILVNACLATGDYDSAFHVTRRRWQVAVEEKAFYQENGYHKREGLDRAQMVHFYSPSTWLDKFWIANRARVYREKFPAAADSGPAAIVDGLQAANDTNRFPARQEEGYQARLEALAPVLNRIRAEGEAAVPYLLPLTYCFTWASLFVPDLLHACGTRECVRLLAELSMFRFPYFSQKCLSCLETFGDVAVEEIREVWNENPAFDELKVGLAAVLGNIRTRQSFDLLVSLMEHESPYVLNWATRALERHGDPEAGPHLDRAKKRLEEFDKMAGVIQELAETFK